VSKANTYQRKTINSVKSQPQLAAAAQQQIQNLKKSSALQNAKQGVGSKEVLSREICDRDMYI
jgi:hypothetical protein